MPESKFISKLQDALNASDKDQLSLENALDELTKSKDAETDKTAVKMVKELETMISNQKKFRKLLSNLLSKI